MNVTHEPDCVVLVNLFHNTFNPSVKFDAAQITAKSLADRIVNGGIVMSAKEHNEYWIRLAKAASGLDGEPGDLVELDFLSNNCAPYITKSLSDKDLVIDAFQAIFDLQDRSVLMPFLENVQDPEIIRMIFDIDDTINADLGDPVGISLASNPYSPKDVLEGLSKIEYDESSPELQIRDVLATNPAAVFLNKL